MSDNPKAAFFDGIAEQWDGWEDLPVLMGRLAAGLEEFGVGAGETVLDVGCGTGNLTRALLDRLSAAGRIVAVDLAPRMIAAARRKVPDPRVEWHVVDARRLPCADASCDRVICYSVWPHLDDRPAVTRELDRVLLPGGCVHVWHLISRERVNQIHATADEAVRHDVLPPAPQTARLFADTGFRITAAVETPESYLVTAVKPAR
jgi:demethylmenaquinone methyltransferase/2-methoxy-6-polyprenyl-1,4-benzoquinol methylase